MEQGVAKMVLHKESESLGNSRTDLPLIVQGG